MRESVVSDGKACGVNDERVVEVSESDVSAATAAVGIRSALQPRSTQRR